MQTIVIEGKDYKCSKRVHEEILWMDSQVKTAKELARQIEDLQDELDTQVAIYQSQINNLLQQLKRL
jgi:flagellar hook-associated protein FlgK